MRLRNIKPHTKKLIAVVSVSILLYAYLNLYSLNLGLRVIFFDIIKAMFSLMPGSPFEFPDTIKAFIFDITLVFVSGALWIFFFGQFVLPVRELTERWQVFLRLSQRVTQNPGPAIWIKDGKEIEAPEKREWAGAGVILLDTASAAVLRKDSGFTRVVGPGLVFTDRKERIASSVDLHKQSRSLGPNDNENPFTPKGDDEDDNHYRDRQMRRMQTSGLTRDGIEVVPNINVTFRLFSEVGDGNTQFGFNKESVRKTVTHEAIDPKVPLDAEAYDVNWDWLPVHVAADLWREYLRKYTLNELFEITIHDVTLTDSQTPLTVFNYLQFVIAQRLQNRRVPEMDDYGNRTGRTITSREYDLLFQHGIEVMSITIANPLVEEEENLIKRWEATWLKRAQDDKKTIESKHNQKEIEGQIEALKEFANTISSPLYQEIRDTSFGGLPRPGFADSLELLSRGILECLRRNQPQGEVMDDDKSKVIEVIEWIRNNRNEIE
jgi:hypothetical protein